VAAPGPAGTRGLVAPDDPTPGGDRVALPGLAGTRDLAAPHDRTPGGGPVAAPGLAGTRDLATPDHRTPGCDPVAAPGPAGTRDLAPPHGRTPSGDPVAAPGPAGTRDLAPPDDRTPSGDPVAAPGPAAKRDLAAPNHRTRGGDTVAAPGPVGTAGLVAPHDRTPGDGPVAAPGSAGTRGLVAPDDRSSARGFAVRGSGARRTPAGPAAERRGGAALLEWTAPTASRPVSRGVPATITSAAVLGRAGEVEPVAAGLALVLRRETRAKAAAVALVGAVPPVLEGAASTGAARRLAARLEAHGHEPRARGRIAWVELDADDAQFAVVARRVALVGAPAVLAVATARTAAVDEALKEQDLVVLVTEDAEGPLAQLAVAGLAGVPILAARPLRRGPAKALARAGVRAARPVRQLLDIQTEGTE
jgi:hypothetical protein